MMNTNFNRFPRQPKGIFAQLVTALVGVIVLGAALMFSLVFFAALAVAGLILWLYFWWKTRALRKQMRDQANAPQEPRQDNDPEASAAYSGEIIEGEAVRVDEEHTEKK